GAAILYFHLTEMKSSPFSDIKEITPCWVNPETVSYSIFPTAGSRDTQWMLFGVTTFWESGRRVKPIRPPYTIWYPEILKERTSTTTASLSMWKTSNL